MHRFRSIVCRIVLALASLPACARPGPTANEPPPASSNLPPLTTAASIRALTPKEAAEGRPVHVRGIITFYDHPQQVMFFQDTSGSIYVDPVRDFPISDGSQVEIWGTTYPGYNNQIEPTQIRELGRGSLPVPVPMNYETALRRENDCRFVTMEGIVRSASLQTVGPARVYLLQFEVDHRMMEVAISNYPGFDPASLLDATVRVTGNLGGNFNQNEQIVGLQLMVTNSSQLAVLKPAGSSPFTLPLTTLEALLQSDQALLHSGRLRTRGTLTLYDPGEKLVIKDGDSNLLVLTRQEDPMDIGQPIEVTGFPSSVNGSPAVAVAQFSRLGGAVVPFAPRPISFAQAMTGKFANDLVSLDGYIVSEAREDHLDTLIMRTDDHRVFQAVFRKRLGDPDPIPLYHEGARIRVTGVCLVHIRGFWGAVESFQIHLRSAEDITVLARPPWWTVRHMLVLTSALLAVFVIALVWGLWMRHRLSRQEKLLRQKIESEAARQASLVRLERQRSHILELINSFEPLPSVVTAIHQYAAEMWPEVFSYTHVLQNRKLHLLALTHLTPADIARLQTVDPTYSSEACANAVRSRSLIPLSLPRSIWSRPLISSHGEILGTMTFEGTTESPVIFNQEAFDFGCNLAAIAIDNRRLYDDVLHRSQHDQLTGLPNRALLDTRLDEALVRASTNHQSAAVLFLDLDDFKSVNDTYSHRIGDLYLSELSQRFKTCLRSRDTLGRVGGDEFIVVIADLISPAQAHVVADRLVQAMHAPFHVEGITIRGTISIGLAIYPESGTTSTELKHQADAAMYAAKRAGGDRYSTLSTLPLTNS